MDATKAPGPGSITLGIAFISEENVMWPIYHAVICILHVRAADPVFLSNPDPYFYMSDLDPDTLKVGSGHSEGKDPVFECRILI